MGAEVEMITSGGEVGFVERMIAESMERKDWCLCVSPTLHTHQPTNLPRSCCRWYTSMLGKLSSLDPVVRRLRENKVRGWCATYFFTPDSTLQIDNYAITAFVQGQTWRWAVGWSFSAFRLPDVRRTTVFAV
jgi:hypothetical protein